jgi:hypothetical protein
MSKRNPLVLASLPQLCTVCEGRPLQLRALDGRWVDLKFCPHCGHRNGIPYLPLPPYQDRKFR